MNSNQRYYAFLALTSNQDFVEKIQQLRKNLSFADYNFLIDGFENPADDDAFILAQKWQYSRATPDSDHSELEPTADRSE